ncbi:MAG: CoA transferase [Ilumatobacteraceae bacterium]
MATPPAENTGPLTGFRVVELGMWVAGPAAGGILADWGADVIKVEPATGDPQRALFTGAGLAASMPVPPFEVDNRGKRSVVLDLRDDDDRSMFEDLLATADAVVTNMRPAALDRLDLGPDAVCARHPRLVYGSITGYGADGPDRDRAGYDVGAYWARSGLAHTIVPPGDMPPGPRSGAGDHQTGMTLVAGMMAKLLERERTGVGGQVSTSLLRTGMYTLAWDLGIQLRFDRRERTRSRDRSKTPLMNSYRTSDERILWLICLEADRHWPKVITALGHPELADDQRFSTPAGRLSNHLDLVAVFDGIFATRPLDEWGPILDEHDVWWAPVQTLPDVIADQQAQPGFVDMATRDGEEPFRAVNTPVDFGGHAVRPGPVPTVGEHTAEVLAELRPTD